MNIESLMKAVLVLHRGNAQQHIMLRCSIAQQIQKNDIHSLVLEGKSVDVVDMIVAAKYNPFTVQGEYATRTIEALTIMATRDMETKLVLQTNHTECPVRNGEIIYEEESVKTQVNQITSIEEYSKICKDFELYFEDDE